MTPDQFEDLLFNAKSKDLRAAFAGLDEKTRKSLSKTAQAAFSSLSRNKAAKQASERIKKFVAKRKGESWDIWDAPINRRAGLALYAVAPLSGVKRQNLWVHGLDQKAIMMGILEDRRPAWLGDWVEWKLEQEFNNLDFETILKWMKDGLIEKPDTPEYYSLYIRSVDIFLSKKHQHGIQPEAYEPLSKRLREDPILFEDVLTVFKYENAALSMNSWMEGNAHPKYQSWSDALLDLMQSGDISREVLLDVSLDSLSEDLKNTQLSSNHKFHLRLEPTEDEIEAREQSYRELLTHPVGHVVKFSLGQIAKLEKAKRLNRAAFLSEIPMVFQNAGKGNAKTALRLAGQIAKSDPKMRGVVLSQILPALDHEDAELQETTLKMIAQYESYLSDDHKNEIARATDFLAASLRPQALALLGQEFAIDTLDVSAENLSRLRHEAQAVSQTYQDAYGLTGLLVEGPFSPTLISSNFGALGLLHHCEPLTPIDNHDQLYTSIAQALETIESISDIELIIDAISRLGRKASPEFLQRLDPLLKRLKSGGTETSRGITQSWNALGHAVIDLIECWITGKLAKRNINTPYYPHNKAAEPMIGHLKAIAKRVACGSLQIRLSTPTHTGGWIDPRIWIERAKAISASSQKTDVPDVCYSMLRLAPDYRDEAAKSVDTLPQPWRAVGRFLFGLDKEPNLSVKAHPVIWISAARARDPFADWCENLSGLHMMETAPDGLRPAHYDWKIVTTVSKPKWSRVNIKTSTYSIKAEPASLRQIETTSKSKVSLLKRLKPKTRLNGSAIPTACLAMNLGSNRWYGGSSGWLYEWMTLFWPQNPAAIYARATYAFTSDQTASSWSTGHGYLGALFQRNRPWGKTGHLLIARGLATKNADIRGYIIDAMIEAIECGQFDPNRVALILQKMIRDGDVKLGRVADGLSRVAEVSPLHASLISMSLNQCVPHLDKKTHALSAMMELWLETLASSGRTANDKDLTWLASFKGGSKSAKAAKKIATLNFNARLDRAVKAQALEARLNLLP